jgi:hypothetical protein
MQTLIAFSLRVRATPLLDHPPPERWLSGEVPDWGHGDCCDDGPQHGGPYEVKGHKGYPHYSSTEDQRTRACYGPVPKMGMAC